MDRLKIPKAQQMLQICKNINSIQTTDERNASYWNTTTTALDWFS
jgi:hypothetical protein